MNTIESQATLLWHTERDLLHTKKKKNGQHHHMILKRLIERIHFYYFHSLSTILITSAVREQRERSGEKRLDGTYTLS